jgi:hypothetical protein
VEYDIICTGPAHLDDGTCNPVTGCSDPGIVEHRLHLKYILLYRFMVAWGARGRVVGSGNMLQAGKSRVRFPMRSLDFQLT